MKPSRPLEIVGGGLGGLALGLALRRAGATVTVFEAGDYPRHRVCGEFITGLDRRTIDRLALAPFLADALRHREVAWFVREKPVRVQRLPSPALGLSRHALDARIASALVAAGGELRTGARVIDPAPRAGRVFATGRRRGESSWIGLKFHVRNLSHALAHDLELHLGEQAYAGLSRVENDRVNVCGLFRRRAITGKGAELLLSYLRAAGLATLAARLETADPDPASCCAVAAVTFDRRVRATDRVAIGDACAMIPPFTGNGMAMAFQSAEIALDPLLAYARGETDWAETCRLIHDALSRRFRLRLASAHALHPYLLHPPRQRLLGAMTRARLIPLRSLYRLLH